MLNLLLLLLLLHTFSGAPAVMAAAILNPHFEKERANVNNTDRSCDAFLATPGQWEDWRPITAVKHGKWIFPFSFQAPSNDTVFSLEFGEVGADEGGILINFRQNYLELVVEFSDSTEIHSYQRDSSGLYPNLLGNSQEVGFWLKIRQKSNEAQVAVYDAGEEKDALAEVTLEAGSVSGDRWRMIVERGEVNFKWNCIAGMESPCSESSECRLPSTACTRTETRLGSCTCDGFLTRSGDECVDVSLAVGAYCTHNKQCWKVEAQCRGPEGSKSCQCPQTHNYMPKSGSCVEKKDIVSETIDLDKMIRTPRYSDLNPGRQPPISSSRQRHPVPYNNRVNAFMDHCSLGRTVDANSQPMKWPIIWKEAGFLVGGFFKMESAGSTGISLAFYSGGSMGFGSPDFQFFFGEDMVLQEGESRERCDGLTPNVGDLMWFFLQYSCQMEMVGCEIKAGMGRGQERRTATFLPQYQHVANNGGPGITSYSLAAAGEGQVEVAAECLGGQGAPCSHPLQCTALQCLAKDTPVCA